jgi:hypothetical protein
LELLLHVHRWLAGPDSCCSMILSCQQASLALALLDEQPHGGPTQCWSCTCHGCWYRHCALLHPFPHESENAQPHERPKKCSSSSLPSSSPASAKIMGRLLSGWFNTKSVDDPSSPCWMCTTGLLLPLLEPSLPPPAAGVAAAVACVGCVGEWIPIRWCCLPCCLLSSCNFRRHKEEACRVCACPCAEVGCCSWGCCLRPWGILNIRRMYPSTFARCRCSGCMRVLLTRCLVVG